MPIVVHTLIHGIILGVLNLAGIFFLESFCQDDIARLKAKKGGAELYRQAVVANFVNIGLGVPITHYLRVVYTSQAGLTLWEQVQSVIGILVLESLFYYFIHKAFHEYRSLYWMHSFHHKFNDVVLPSTACAVSIAEFSIAYMLPIVAGSHIMKADRISGIIASGIIGVSNLMIHSPFMTQFEFPDWLASASSHFRHHRKLTTDYGAPLLHFDSILGAKSAAKE